MMNVEREELFDRPVTCSTGERFVVFFRAFWGLGLEAHRCSLHLGEFFDDLKCRALGTLDITVIRRDRDNGIAIWQ